MPQNLREPALTSPTWVCQHCAPALAKHW